MSRWRSIELPPGFVALAMLIFAASAPSAYGYESDMSFGLYGGYNDNVPQGSEAFKRGSIYARTTLGLSLDWGSDESIAAPFIDFGVESETYPDSGIVGNVSFDVRPGFKVYFLDRSLKSTFDAMFSRNTNYAVSLASLGGARGKGVGSGAIDASSSAFTNEPYTSTEFRWRPEYSWDESRAGAFVRYGRQNYLESERIDDVRSLEFYSGTSVFEPLDVSFGMGLASTVSDVEDSSYSGPYGYLMAIVPVSELTSFSLLVRGNSVLYDVDTEESIARNDRGWSVELGLDYELGSGTTLELSVVRRSNLSTSASASYALLEGAAGFHFTF